MISVVIPCYNETDVLHLTYRSLLAAAEQWAGPFEIILVDDGSTDNTWSIIEELALQDSRVRGFRLSRNFGHQAALGAGLERVEGKVVVVLDADLQDPPELVEQMLGKWQEGYDVVFAQRRQREGETWFKRTTAMLFYRLLGRINSVNIPRDTGDFCLMDARVVRTLLDCKEHALFWRGLRSWTGFRQTHITFDRPARAAGTAKYTFWKSLRLALNGIVNFSELPLRLPLYLGGVLVGATGLAAVLAVVCMLIGSAPPVSWTALGLWFIGAVQLLCMGLMGEYLNRIYEETRGRPRWIVDRTMDRRQAATEPRRHVA